MADKPKPIVFDFDSIDAVHDETLSQSPEANQDAIDAQAGEELETLRAEASNTDKDGTIFDADIHAVNKDGEPSVTPTGKFRKKRGSVVATKSAAEKTMQDELAARAAGYLAADLVVGTSIALLGDEWIPIGETGEQEPIKYDEHSMLRKAFGDYFVAKNISDFPPGIALSIALSSYAGARLAGGKETKSRLSKAWAWTSDKFKNLFKKGKKNAAHDSTRDNGVRKDDTGEVSLQSSEKTGERHAST